MRVRPIMWRDLMEARNDQDLAEKVFVLFFFVFVNGLAVVCVLFVVFVVGAVVALLLQDLVVSGIVLGVLAIVGLVSLPALRWYFTGGHE